jgi:hypothetical protein
MSCSTNCWLGEFDQWAAPLQDTFVRVLAENLSLLLGTDRVLLHPWPRTYDGVYGLPEERCPMIDTPLHASATGTTWKFCPLLISLLLLLLLSPYLEGREIFVKALGQAVLLSGLYTVSRDKRVFVYACILGIPTLAAEAMNILTALRHAEVVARVGAVFFLSFTTASILWHVFTEAEVTADTLYGAACAYLLSGVTWATLYTLIEALQPGAFAVNVAQRPHQGVT